MSVADELVAEIRDETIVAGAVRGAHPHIAYSLRLRHGERSWSVTRRFSQFNALRAALRADGCPHVPPLPPKGPWRLLRLLCMADHRRPGLEGFLQLCCSEGHLCAHAAFRSFIAVPAVLGGAAACQTDISGENALACLTETPDGGSAASQTEDHTAGELPLRKQIDEAVVSAVAGKAAAASAQIDALCVRSQLAIARATLAECEASIRVLGAEAAEARACTAGVEAECARLKREKETLLMQADELKGAVRVYARIRPLTPAEERHTAGVPRPACMLAGATPAGLARSVHVWAPSDADTLAGRMDAPLSHTSSHEFDRAFGPEHSEDEVFSELAPLARDAVAGVRATVLAYGQTGSGKTHTMRHVSRHIAVELLRRADEDGSGIELWVSAVEVYNEALRDLLPCESGPAPLQLRYGATGVARLEGVQCWGPVRGVEEAEALLEQAHQRRATADNGTHARSSRSHLVLELSLRRAGVAFGQMTLVDLAGSERLGRTSADGVRREEAIEINLALSALGDVIGALVARTEDVPYCNSKLTALLQPGMRRGCRVVMIVTASPAAVDAPETAAALTFASRARTCRLGPQLGGLGPPAAPMTVAAAFAAKESAKACAKGRARELARAKRAREEAQRMLEESRREVWRLRSENAQLKACAPPVESAGQQVQRAPLSLSQKVNLDQATPVAWGSLPTKLTPTITSPAVGTAGQARHKSRLPAVQSTPVAALAEALHLMSPLVRGQGRPGALAVG